MKRETTLHPYVALLCLTLIGLMLPHTLQAEGRIRLKTDKAINQSIGIKIKANGSVRVSGATGKFKNGSTVYYKLSAQEVTFEGEILQFENLMGEITALHLENTTSLQELNVNFNKIEQIDLSACPQLTYINVMSNQLTRLDLSSNPLLTSINLAQNKVSELNIEACTAVASLDCGNNALTSLNLSNNTQLGALNCSFNKLSTLDLSALTALKQLNCAKNELTQLDISHNRELEILSCNDCKLTQLDLTHNRKLSKLSCSGNALGTLDLSQNSELEVLWCAMTGLQTLDLTPFAKLRQVLCQANSLTSIELSHNPALTLFWGSSNQFTSLDFSHNPQLLEAFFYDNRIDESHMEQLIASLPQRTASDQAGLIVIQPNSTTEQNICRVEQVDKAKAKHYKVYAALNSNATAKEEYPGSVDCELIGITAVRCYPNPASHFVQISQATPSSTIRLIDASGNLLLEERTSDMGDAQLDVRHLPVGSYLLIVDNAPHRLLIAH